MTEDEKRDFINRESIKGEMRNLRTQGYSWDKIESLLSELLNESINKEKETQ